jgi:uncharacterized protein (DUF2147 family)
LKTLHHRIAPLAAPLAAFLALLLTSSAALAQATPAGLWKTIDDDTKAETSIVRIVEAGGAYTGRIEKLLGAHADAGATCQACTDERKGQPIVGMSILRNLRQNAENREIFDGGDITDPGNGKVYRARLKPIEGGKKLEVRGYIGPFYRTQVWLRSE